MSITDQALKKLETGLTLCWNLNRKLKARATEIIESLAKQLEAKGDLTEEYKRWYRDGVKSAKEFTCKNTNTSAWSEPIDIDDLEKSLLRLMEDDAKNKSYCAEFFIKARQNFEPKWE